MKFLPSFLIMLLFLFTTVACYTPKGTHSKTLSEPDKPIFDFIVLFIPTDEDIHQLDRASYENLFKGNFNDLQHKNFRDHLSDSFRKSFKGIFVHDYRNFFSDHHLYSYEEFISALKHDGVSHVLVVTLKSEKNNVRPIITSDLAIPVNYTDRSYQLYLFNVDQPAPIWLSYGFPTFTGGLNGVRNTAKQLARGAARELDKEQLLYASRYGRIN